jgi:hypothetical protein
MKRLNRYKFALAGWISSMALLLLMFWIADIAVEGRGPAALAFFMGGFIFSALGISLGHEYDDQ